MQEIVITIYEQGLQTVYASPPPLPQWYSTAICIRQQGSPRVATKPYKYKPFKTFIFYFYNSENITPR